VHQSAMPVTDKTGTVRQKGSKMDSILVKGNGPLSGQIPIAGAKNTVLKLMCAALLTDEPLTLTNVPRLADIRTLSDVLTSLGCEIASLSKTPRASLIPRRLPIV